MNGKGIAINVAGGRVQAKGRTWAQEARVKPAEQPVAQQVTLLRLTALRLVYQAIRKVEDVELCEAGLSG